MAYTDTEQNTLKRVVNALREQTGLNVRVLQTQPRLVQQWEYQPDALIEVEVPPKTYQFAVEIKNIDRFEILNQIRTFWPRHADPQLLVAAPHITAQAAERCREMNLYFADTAGNAYLQAPGLYVYVTGKRKNPDLKIEEGRMNNPAALKVVFALLCQPGLLNATYREIAATAHVALGTVGPVIKDLENRKHITELTPATGTTRRVFLDPQRLLQEWVAFYPTVLRPKLNIRRFRAQNPGWTEQVNLRAFEAFWGGEVAANRLTRYLQPQMATVYARHNPARLIAEQRMRADLNGDVEILDVFWNPNIGTGTGTQDVVPPILAYADLLTTTDGRNLEAAKVIYDEYIGPTIRNFA